VNQKSGAPDDEAPDADIPPTSVTAIDGVLTSATVADVTGSTSLHRRRPRHHFGRFNRRQSGFEEIFPGLPSDQHDAAVEGTAYLTYTLVPNSTYNVDACLAWAATIDGCGAYPLPSCLIRFEVADIVTVNLVFVNLYYEFNNYLLDFVFSEESNLKCVAYADIHSAAEKTNFGGQASYPQAGSYIFSSVAPSHAQCRSETRPYPSLSLPKAVAGASRAWLNLRILMAINSSLALLAALTTLSA
jgi:hypothetical protein